jgi:uncharacterized protein (TIGR03083 family)
MEPDQYLAAITTESTALADAAERAGLDTPVPSCPEWTVADLVAHVGEVQQWARIMVEQRAQERIPRRSLPSAPPGAELVPWFREQAPALVGTLASTDPTTPMWTFSDDGTVRFWCRRQAHEVAIHRWDAELAAGAPSPIDTALAADGIDEYLGMLQFRNAPDLVGNGETIHLHCTDTAPEIGGEWVVTLGAAGVNTARVHEKSDVAVRGTASDLDLFVLGRLEPSAFEVFGDSALLARFHAATGF